MIKNIVFDMGGVLVDVHRERAIEAFKAIGVANASELIDSYHHKGIFLDIESGAIDEDEFCRLLCLEAGKEIAKEEIEKAWRSIIDPPEEYKLQYLLDLRLEGYRTYILSNNNSFLIDGWARKAEFTCLGKPLPDFFDRCYFSYQMGCVKPGKEIFGMFIEHSGVEPCETLYLDDSLANIEAAAKAGFETIYIENGTDWREAVNRKLRYSECS